MTIKQYVTKASKMCIIFWMVVTILEFAERNKNAKLYV